MGAYVVATIYLKGFIYENKDLVTDKESEMTLKELQE